MLSLNNDFIGHHPTAHNVLFSSTDSEELYHKNLKIQPANWHYRTHKITYERNSNGHRCREIKDIDLNNYILFTGCSHTEGIGLELENTYAYLLSNKLKCDYYNLAVAGTGMDVLQYNLVTWLSKIKHPPKLIVVQWPQLVRVTIQHNDDNWGTYGPWSALNENIKNRNDLGNFLILGEDIGFFKTTKFLTKKIIFNISPCPILQVGLVYSKSHDDEYILHQVDSGRDMKGHFGHMGIKSDLITATMLYQKAIKLINT